METHKIIEGLEILEQYRNKSGFDVCAEHDVLYAYSTDQELTQKDLGRMIEMGWHQEYIGLDYSTDFSSVDYKVDENWFCYV